MAVQSSPPSTGYVEIEQCIQTLRGTEVFLLKTFSDLNEKREEFDAYVALTREDLKRAKEIHDDRVDREKADLREERGEFEETKRAGDYFANDGKTRIVVLNVGGTKFETDMRTLQRQRDSIFPRLVQACDQTRPKTEVFIDRDPAHFRFILNYMRQGEEVLGSAALRGKDRLDLQEMICEAKHYRLNAFMKLLEWRRVRLVNSSPVTFPQLVNKKFFKAPGFLDPKYETTNNHEFRGWNMDKIEFDGVHFKHSVSFKGSVLAGAKFNKCIFAAKIDFTDVDITRVIFNECAGTYHDRLVMDGYQAEKVGVIFDPGVDLRKFTTHYGGQCNRPQ